ncbi:MAG TPA: hypothetical protein VJ782_05650 [Aeromicrobium sp.]|nr:hypothetical protein [Aeromicrobium sp.]
MSIFEPIPRESRFDDVTQELDEELTDDVAAPDRGSLDPRSIVIAGGVVAAIVVAGLVVSNLAEPVSRSRPLVAERVNPGAAAVEQVEAKRPAPTEDASASPSVEPVDEDDAPAGDAPNDSGDDHSSGSDKRDSKPGKGNGRGRR